MTRLENVEGGESQREGYAEELAVSPLTPEGSRA
jgi:hypothetical protein